MARSAVWLYRVLADIFPGRPRTQEGSSDQEFSSPSQTPSHEAVGALHVVGRGGPNERQVAINGIPHLFVDEGDHVVEFTPAFEEIEEDTIFGLKIMPELEPHWSKTDVHRCSLKEAITTSIRNGGRPLQIDRSAQALPDGPRSNGQPVEREIDEAPSAPDHQRASPRQQYQSSDVVGRILSWGEEKFPDRKSGGARFYKSFAMHIDTETGERTLQGEGLKEAIAECRCAVGDVVSVRRLRKIKVPAIKSDGSPKIVNGKQVMWDKWLWKISV
jgi:hypothetical protein